MSDKMSARITPQGRAYVEWVTGLDTEPPLDGAFSGGWLARQAELDHIEAAWKADLAAADRVMVDLRGQVEELTAILNSHRRQYADGRLPTWTCEATDEEIIDILLPVQDLRNALEDMTLERDDVMLKLHAADAEIGRLRNALTEIHQYNLPEDVHVIIRQALVRS